MKPRAPEPPKGGLPVALAVGPLADVWARDVDVPDHLRGAARAEFVAAAALSHWHDVGRQWSIAVGLGWNGWEQLLASEVRRSVSARSRLERMLADHPEAFR